MRWSMGLLAALVAAAWSVPSAAADPIEVPATEFACMAGGLPPCGYVQPTLSLDFPDKPQCRTGNKAPADPAKCLQLPLKDGSLAQEGTLRWWWDITLDGAYPLTGGDIQITFKGTALNPKWLKATVEPSSFTLSVATFADPANYKVDPTTQKVIFSYEEPIKVTFERTGDPTPQDLKRYRDNGGVVPFTLKGISTESPSFYKAAFGTEQFNFWPTDFGTAVSSDPSAQPSGQNAPAPAGVAIIGLAMVAFASRRR